MNSMVINLFYLLSALLFVVGIKGLTRPKTATREPSCGTGYVAGDCGHPAG